MGERKDNKISIPKRMRLGLYIKNHTIKINSMDLIPKYKILRNISFHDLGLGNSSHRSDNKSTRNIRRNKLDSHQN